MANPGGDLLRPDILKTALINYLGTLETKASAWQNTRNMVTSPNLEPGLEQACDQIVDLYRTNDPCQRVESIMSEFEPMLSNIAGGINRFDFIKTIATRANQAPVIYPSQLMSIANYGPPGLGVYRETNAVGNLGGSFFATPLELLPDYAASYANRVLDAYKEYDTEKGFSPEDQFQVVVIGDFNLKIVNQLNKKLKKQIRSGQVKITIVDNSKQVAKNITAKAGDTQFIEGDARNLDPVLDHLDGKRGVLIAGEELIDDFPSEEFVYRDGSVQIPYYNLSGAFPILEYQPIAESPYHQELWEQWLKAFPEYLDFIKTPAKDGMGRIVVNPGFLSLIKSIAESRFDGKWIGGDYCTDFANKRGGINLNLTNGLAVVDQRELTRVSVKGYEDYLEHIFDETSNITADVDFGLLRYAQAKGMNSEFFDTLGRFKDSKPLDLEAVQVSIRNLQTKLATCPNDNTSLTKLTEAVNILEFAYSSNRINWVMNFKGIHN